MVVIKRAVALLLMTILIAMNATVAYAVEPGDLDTVPDDTAASTAASSTEEKVERKKEDEPASEDGNEVVTDLKEQKPEGAQSGTEQDGKDNTDNTPIVKQENGEDAVVFEGEPLEDLQLQNLQLQDLPLEDQLLEDQLLDSKLLDSKLLEKQPLKESEAVDSDYDVCFYIRGGGIDYDIPREPAIHYSSRYSAPIRVDDAIKFGDLSLSTSEEGGSEDNLLSDYFTASNGVTATLSKLPSAEDIKRVVPGFDPEIHYVVWYVVKRAYTVGSNWDVGIHVDGVIRTRQTAIDIEHYKKLDELESHLEFHIVPKLLDENGVPLNQIEYDGLPHKVGGFDIVVVDTLQQDEDGPKKLIEYIYNCLGELLDVKVYASEDCTEFEYDNEKFFLNITSIYTYVTDELDDLHFYRGSTEVSDRDITVTDIRGVSLADKVSIDPISNLQGSGNSNPYALKRRNLEITARSTVKNDDGSTLTNGGFDITKGSLLEGHKLESVTIVGSRTGVGCSLNEITSVVIVDEKGKDVTKLYYDVHLVNGKLQLVDGKKKGSKVRGTSQYTSTTPTEDAAGIYMPNSTNTAKKSTTEILNGRVARARVTHADGSVTYINVPFETGYGNDLSSNQPQVLGARRGATDDPTSDMINRIMVILLLMGVVIWSLQKNNNSSAIG